MTVGSYLLDKLYQQDVRHIFGVPGDYILLFNKLVESHAIQFVNATRENTAGYMAEAYARFNGLGVVCITYGVGLNIVNAAAQAFTEDTPLVIISGAPGKKELEKSQHLHHLIDKTNTQIEILRHVTAYQAILTPTSASEQIQEAISTAITLKKPVYLELPRDVVLAPLGAKAASHMPLSTDPLQLKNALLAAQKALNNSHKPFLWLGHQILREGLSEDLEAFIEKTKIPFVTSLFGKSTLDEHHPLFAGVYQGALSSESVCHFIEEADCALTLGVLLSDLDTGLFTAKTNQSQQIFAKDDRVIVNGKDFYPVRLKDFVKGFASLNYHSNTPIHAVKQQRQPSEKITAQSVFDILQQYLSKDLILAADIGDSLFGSSDLTLYKNSFLSSAYFGTMGFAIPAAIGAQFATGKQTIAIVGDGSFQMTGTELTTAARYNLNIITIVLNNQGYGTERPLLEGKYNDIHNWNYTAITNLLQKGTSYKVKTAEAFQKALQEALFSKEFVLIEVELEKEDFSNALHRFGKVMKQTVL